jgi:hypothetical protein
MVGEACWFLRERHAIQNRELQCLVGFVGGDSVVWLVTGTLNRSEILAENSA